MSDQREFLPRLWKRRFLLKVVSSTFTRGSLPTNDAHLWIVTQVSGFVVWTVMRKYLWHTSHNGWRRSWRITQSCKPMFLRHLFYHILSKRTDKCQLRVYCKLILSTAAMLTRPEIYFPENLSFADVHTSHASQLTRFKGFSWFSSSFLKCSLCLFHFRWYQLECLNCPVFKTLTT